MKRLSSHSDVAHAWAQQTYSDGSCGNMFFEGRAIYSYGYHFMMGVIFPEDKVAILNSDSYSPTTSGHQALTRSSVPRDYNVIEISGRFMSKYMDIHKLALHDYIDEALVLPVISSLNDIMNSKTKGYTHLWSFFDRMKNIYKISKLLKPSLKKARHKAIERVSILFDSNGWEPGMFTHAMNDAIEVLNMFIRAARANDKKCRVSYVRLTAEEIQEKLRYQEKKIAKKNEKAIENFRSFKSRTITGMSNTLLRVTINDYKATIESSLGLSFTTHKAMAGILLLAAKSHRDIPVAVDGSGTKYAFKYDALSDSYVAGCHAIEIQEVINTLTEIANG